MLISQRIEKLAAEHDDSRRTIGLFLIEQANRFDGLTMADIAQETYTSKATLVRFAKQLGYDGWTDFARAYSREIDRNRQNALEIDHSVPFAAGALPADIVAAVAQVRFEATMRTAQHIDVRDVSRAVDLLMAAPRIAVFGYGFNVPLLDSFARKMQQIGVPVLQPPQDQYAHVAKMLGAGDCLIVASYAGASQTTNMLKYLPDVRRSGGNVIALTSEGENYLRDNADITLSIFSCERLFAKIGTFSTEASTACLLDMLYACYFARDYERNFRYKVGNSRATEENRKGM